MVQLAVLQKKNDTGSLDCAGHEGATRLFCSKVLLQTAYANTWDQILVCRGRSVIHAVSSSTCFMANAGDILAGGTLNLNEYGCS